jgi:predicted phosphodiesterase
VRPASHETYVGAARSEGFRAAGGGLRAGRTHDYEPAPVLRLNEWTLAGRWKVGEELAELERAGGRIAYRFKARDLHLVLGPADDGRPVRFRVRLDGQPPGPAGGSDLDASGMGIELHESPHSFEVGGRRILLVHDLGEVAARSLESHEIIIHGFTHQQEIRELAPNATIINPGEACGWLHGVPSAAILDLETKDVEFISLTEPAWKV